MPTSASKARKSEGCCQISTVGHFELEWRRDVPWVYAYHLLPSSIISPCGCKSLVVSCYRGTQPLVACVEDKADKEMRESSARFDDG